MAVYRLYIFTRPTQSCKSRGRVRKPMSRVHSTAPPEQ